MGSQEKEVTQALLDPVAHQDLPETKEWMVFQDHLALPGWTVTLVQQEAPDQMVSEADRVCQELMETRVDPEDLELGVTSDHLVAVATPECRDHLVPREALGQLAHPEHQVEVDPTAMKDQKEWTDHLVHADCPVR